MLHNSEKIILHNNVERDDDSMKSPPAPVEFEIAPQSDAHVGHSLGPRLSRERGAQRNHHLDPSTRADILNSHPSWLLWARIGSRGFVWTLPLATSRGT